MVIGHRALVHHMRTSQSKAEVKPKASRTLSADSMALADSPAKGMKRAADGELNSGGKRPGRGNEKEGPGTADDDLAIDTPSDAVGNSQEKLWLDDCLAMERWLPARTVWLATASGRT